jgi:hypothetical protein
MACEDGPRKEATGADCSLVARAGFSLIVRQHSLEGRARHLELVAHAQEGLRGGQRRSQPAASAQPPSRIAALLSPTRAVRNRVMQAQSPTSSRISVHVAASPLSALLGADVVISAIASAPAIRKHEIANGVSVVGAAIRGDRFDQGLLPAFSGISQPACIDPSLSRGSLSHRSVGRCPHLGLWARRRGRQLHSRRDDRRDLP